MACFPIGSPIAYLHRDHDRAGWPDFGPLHLSELVSKGYHVKMVVDSLGGVLEGCQGRFAVGALNPSRIVPNPDIIRTMI